MHWTVEVLGEWSTRELCCPVSDVIVKSSCCYQHESCFVQLSLLHANQQGADPLRLVRICIQKVKRSWAGNFFPPGFSHPPELLWHQSNHENTVWVTRPLRYEFLIHAFPAVSSHLHFEWYCTTVAGKIWYYSTLYMNEKKKTLLPESFLHFNIFK